jgi:hypothetical protein
MKWGRSDTPGWGGVREMSKEAQNSGSLTPGTGG